MKYVTETQLRDELRKRLRGKTQAQLAKEMHVKDNFLSMVLNGAPVTGKIVSFLGFRKIRTKFYERAQ